MNIMGYEIYIEKLGQIDLITKRKIINTINPHSYIMAKQDKVFQQALKASDVLIPDGSGIVLAANFIYNKKIKKIAGANLHTYLLNKLNKNGGKVFYMGTAQKTLDLIHTRLKKEYPNIEVSSYSPPFKNNFSEKENTEIINKINNFKPDILFVGMTAPKQEKWLYAHKDRLDFKVAGCIGAVFDFYAGTVKRPPEFFIKIHLEWLYRFLQEPKRLWKRNFISTPLFLQEIIKYKFNILTKF